MGAQWGESIARGQLPRAWREGATWSYSEPKVGNFRIFAPPIHVAALWPVAFGFRGDSNNRTECAVVLIRFANLKNASWCLGGRLLCKIRTKAFFGTV